MLGYLVSQPFTDSLKILIGFVVGAFPARTLLDYAKSIAKKNINLVADAHPSQGPTLHNIQGMTTDMIDILYGEGITSTAHLSQADPIKLLLKTSIEWKLILDIIDQSILFNYVEDKLKSLRSIGIRGAIELAAMQLALKDKDDKERTRAQSTVMLIASKLKDNEEAVYNLIRMLYDDVQVEFIWDLWGEAVPK